MKANHKPRMGSRGQPDQSRAAILQAAVGEFARAGAAGARTDAIARAAGVNKALLYYYFKDKESLYGAVLDHVFGGLSLCVQQALSCQLSPRDKILAYAAAHFDYIATHPLYPPIVQGEMMGAARGSGTRIRRIVNMYFRPLHNKLVEVLRAGQVSGEIRPGDPAQFVFSLIAIVVFYFGNAPVMRLVTGKDPFSPELVARRREAVFDFISAALFPDYHIHPVKRNQGARL
jgi:TetR/AcrR family transcriptional regulator